MPDKNVFRVVQLRDIPSSAIVYGSKISANGDQLTFVQRNYVDVLQCPAPGCRAYMEDIRPLDFCPVCGLKVIKAS